MHRFAIHRFGLRLRWERALLTAALLAIAFDSFGAESSGGLIRFNIGRGHLADALDRFSEQSNLQVVYRLQSVQDHIAPALRGEMTADRALAVLLASSGLTWKFLDELTVVIRDPTQPENAVEQAEPPADRPRSPTGKDNVAILSDIGVTEDRRWLTNEVSSSAFGFDKPLLETPRTVSVISGEAIDLFGLSAVEDLVRVVPGVFTTTRFGIQGAVDVRNVPAETYFRGMKRLSLQGHGRSVLAAMDSIEVVGGPPSPIYGMGKIGGYTNLVPKSGRAKSGSYLSSSQGFAQLIVGEYNKAELSYGLGGPLSLFGKQGGYYVYGLHEDSDSYTQGVPVKQDVVQAAISVKDFAGPFRLETGANYQVSRTAGALIGRLTQDLVDTGKYIRGTPLVNLDLNGNGAIGYLEMQNASPVRGPLTANNQPLLQTWAWPRDAQGKPLPLGQFPKVAGIPQSMYNYLVAHPEADPTGLLRAQGIGGPLPVSGSVPVGMVLDPRTVGYDTLDLSHAAAFERDLKAQFLTLFIDLVDDIDPNFTVKNQLFFDGMDQHKSSNQPFSQKQKVYVWEDKVTLSKRFTSLPQWLRVNSLLSVNYRETVSEGKMTLADFSNQRTDAMAPTWTDSNGGLTANTTFASANDNSDIYNDGLPWASQYRSRFSELGLGVLFDIDFFSNTNLLLGARIDGSRAHNVDQAGSFNFNSGTSAQPGSFSTRDVSASGWDSGTSWSISLSRQLPGGLRPYATWSRSSIVLDANNNMLTNAAIQAGHVGMAELREIGLKASWLNGRLFFTTSMYQQGRMGVNADDDPSLISTYATTTTTRGWETELKWVPFKDLYLSLYTLRQFTKYDPNVGTTQLIDARTLGFQDVLDANGNVIYPAEAFLYGGRSRILIPSDVPGLARKQGNPETQAGFTATYQMHRGVGFTLNGNYFSTTCSGRLCLVMLPSAFVLNTGIFWNYGMWTTKFDIYNVTDERYFRARTGETLGDMLAQAMPDRHWQFTVRVNF